MARYLSLIEPDIFLVFVSVNAFVATAYSTFGMVEYIGILSCQRGI